MNLIFATTNAHKVAEIKAVLPPSITLLSLRDAGIAIDIPEPYDTLEANAQEKARVIYSRTGAACFSEDTGLEVAALQGAPGVRSARFAGETATAAQNLEKLMGLLKSSTDRRARFRTIICLKTADAEHLFEGICEGHIATTPTGTEGFGYDPVFVPDGALISFAEMPMATKATYSHRRKAVDKLVAFLNGLRLNT